jgi:hypothetical protein
VNKNTVWNLSKIQHDVKSFSIILEDPDTMYFRLLVEHAEYHSAEVFILDMLRKYRMNSAELADVKVEYLTAVSGTQICWSHFEPCYILMQYCRLCHGNLNKI